MLPPRCLILAILLTAIQPAFAGEQSGPNPGNLTPSGAHTVDLFTGAFTYSYPIVVPPGRHGIQPDLKLVYNSQANNGWLGVGWDLSVGSIHRSARYGVPTYNDGQDTFAFTFQGQTQTLVQTGSGSDSNGSYLEYRAQIEAGFMRFRYHNSASPRWWEVRSKDGKVYRFDFAVNNFFWGLTKVTDPNGNSMTIAYAISDCTGPHGFGAPGGAGGGAGEGILYMPSSIQYTANASGSGLNPTNQVLFEFAPRSDPLTSYSSGSKQTLSCLLNDIRVQVFNMSTNQWQDVRVYNMSYNTNSAGNSLLLSITESVPSFNETHTTSFGYQDTGGGFTWTQWNANPIGNVPVPYGTVSAGDFNGDGLSDIYYSQYPVSQNGDYNHYVGLSNGQSIQYSAWTNKDLQSIAIADYNNDGKSDLFGINHGGTPPGQYVGLSNGSALNNPSVWEPSNPANQTGFIPLGPGDANGDGLTDNLMLSQGALMVDYNQSNNSFNYRPWDNLTWNLDCGPNSQNCEIRTGDFDGDGMTDLVVYNTNNSPSQTWVGLSGGNPHGLSVWNSLPMGNASTPMSVGDFNGDGLSDVVYYNSSDGNIYVGMGAGSRFDMRSWGTPPSFNDTAKSTFRVGDFNGDGLSDIAFYDGTQTWVGLSNGSKFTFYLWGQIGDPNFNSNGFLVGDFNGDGKSDLAAVNQDLQTWVGLSQGNPINLLTTITNPLGGTVSVSYQTYKSGNANTLPFPVVVVSSVTVNDGMPSPGNSSVTTLYSYSGGLFDKTVWKDREFLGFGQVTTTDAQGNYTITHFLQHDNAANYNNVNVFKGKISEQDNYDSSGNLLAKTVNTYAVAQPFTGVYFPSLTQVDTSLGAKNARTQYQYDAYGNLTQELDLGDVNGSGSEKRTFNTDYFPNANDYLVGYPAHKKLLNADGSAATESWLTYDGANSYTQPPTQGLVTKTESWLAGGGNPVVKMSYDAYGNLTDEYDAVWNAANGTQGNHVHRTYETTTYQFPQSVTQGAGSLNLTETFTFDPATGQMLSRSDANNQTTTYRYDVFGRLTRVFNPNDSDSMPTVSYSYSINPSPPHSILASARVASGQSGTLDTYTFFDGLGRTRETKAPGTGGNQIVSDIAAFDSRGLVAKNYLPFTTAASNSFTAPDSGLHFSSTLYDALGRVTSATHPDGTVTNKSYQDWTETVTDANGHARNSVKDAYGRIAQVNEHNQGQTYVTTYHYDVLNNLKQITNSLNQNTLITYDTLGRKTGINDPQMGSWQYQYDANGNLKSQTDAKNQNLQMTYDPGNRLLTKSYPDGTSINDQYDTGNFAKGRLSQVTDLSGTQAFSYDNLGRVVQKARTVGGSNYVTQMAYDDLDRETSVTTPNNNSVQNNYNGGMLTSVKDPQSGTVYASLTYDNTAVGKLKTVGYGNGVNANYAYQPNNFYLSSLGSKNSSGQTLQNFGYTYDNVGNVKNLSDSVGGMNQSFQYDDLDRLTQAAGPYGSKSYQYDSLGNITTNPEYSEGSWGFEDLSQVTALQGTVYQSNGRLGNGLYLDGASVAQLNGTDKLQPSNAISVELWVRPLTQGTTAYCLSKQGSFAFPVLHPDGSLDAQLSLNSGLQTIHVSSVTYSNGKTYNAARFNLWGHYVMTYDGSTFKVYVNGQLAGQQSASGLIANAGNPILLGTGFKGILDEINIHPRALSAQEVLLRFQSAPAMPPNQPLTPAPVTGGLVSGQLNVAYGFTFAAWDLDGGDVQYIIDWGTGTITQQTGYVPSGVVVISTRSWNAPGTYGIRVQAATLPPGTTTQLLSPWSPNFNIYITSAVSTLMNGIPLIGAEAGVSTDTANNLMIKNTAGEWVTSHSASGLYQASWGYPGPISAPSPWWAIYLGAQGTGGAEATPPSKLAVSDFVNLTGSTPQDVNTIALGLRQNGYVQLRDANGNQQLGGNRWIRYDYENRPVRIITPDGTTTDFVYDFEGNRVTKTISAPGTSPQTSTYIGQIYEVTGGKTIQYINAGSLRVAMLTSSGDLLYYLPDHLGSANVMMDSSTPQPAQVRSDQYTPFGSLYATSPVPGTSNAKDSDYKFTGQRLDDTTGLYYYGARYYDPLLARFITPDTVIQSPYDPQTLNRYAYCRNNPVVYTDSTGHWFGIDDLAAVVVYTAINVTMAATHGGNVWTAAWQGAAQGVAYDIGNDLGGGPIGGAMLAGAVGGSFNGGGLQGAAEGAAIAGVSAGISSHIPIPSNAFAAAATRIATGAGVGAGTSALMGGSASQGAMLGAESAAMSVAYSDIVGEIAPNSQAQTEHALKTDNASITITETWPPTPVDNNNLVIGKVEDLDSLRPGEYTLQLPDLGDKQTNWYQNAGELRLEMGRGQPIRDASPNWERTYPASFLDAERNLMQNHGWTYDKQTHNWYPPKR
jgi:RHS repeat-associated protein